MSYDIDDAPPLVVVKRRHNDKILVTDSNDRDTKLAFAAISKVPEEARTVFQLEYANANMLQLRLRELGILDEICILGY